MENNYINCIWCGKQPTQGVYAQYCDDKCKQEAQGTVCFRCKLPWHKQATDCRYYGSGVGGNEPSIV